MSKEILLMELNLYILCIKVNKGRCASKIHCDKIPGILIVDLCFN